MTRAPRPAGGHTALDGFIASGYKGRVVNIRERAASCCCCPVANWAPELTVVAR